MGNLKDDTHLMEFNWGDHEFKFIRFKMDLSLYLNLLRRLRSLLETMRVASDGSIEIS